MAEYSIDGPIGRAEARPTESGFSLIELVTILLQQKRFIVGATLAVTAATALIAWLLPVTFKAEATILPPQQQQSTMAALASGSLGALAGSGMASQLGLRNPGDLYIGILASRTISDNLIARFRLQDVYRTELISQTRKALANHASFTLGKDSIITIAVDDHNPKRAADLANAYVDELYKLNSRLAITDAGRRRLFFGQELAKEEGALADAEVALKATQQTTGLLVPAGQAEVLIRSGAQLRAEIASREVQLRAMRAAATDENPHVQVLKEEMAALHQHLNQLEAKTATGSRSEMSAGSFSENSLEFIRKLRDVKYHETLFELLAKQYESSRLDEAKEGPIVQVIDAAAIPDHKNWPPRALLSLIGGAAGLIGACLFTLFRQAFRSLSRIPDCSEQLQGLNAALRSWTPTTSEVEEKCRVQS